MVVVAIFPALAIFIPPLLFDSYLQSPLDSQFHGAIAYIGAGAGKDPYFRVCPSSVATVILGVLKALKHLLDDLTNSLFYWFWNSCSTISA